MKILTVTRASRRSRPVRHHKGLMRFPMSQRRVLFCFRKAECTIGIAQMAIFTTMKILPRYERSLMNIHETRRQLPS